MKIENLNISSRHRGLRVLSGYESVSKDRSPRRRGEKNGMPHRKATDQQRAALVKARAALTKKHTCERCGAYDPFHGLQKGDGRIYNTIRDGTMHCYCNSCQIYFRWLDDRQRVEAHLQALFEQKVPFWLLATETTGKKPEHPGL